MIKLLSLALASTLCVGLTLVSSPAQAGTAAGTSGYTVRVDDVVYDGDGCVSSTIYFSAPTNPSIQHYNADVTITAADGSVEDSDFFYENSGSQGQNTLCTYSDPYGQYTVKVDFEGQDADYNLIAESHDITTFQFTHSAGYASSLSSQRLRLGRHAWKVRAHLTHGGAVWAGRPVFLQYYAYGSWSKLGSRRPWVRSTDAAGNVVLPFPAAKRQSNRIRYRLHADGTPNIAEANSAEFRLPKR